MTSSLLTNFCTEVGNTKAAKNSWNMQNDILSLQETSENVWQAKYLGNYGTYNIKIIINKGKIETFSCSCPSDYSPCKHIDMIKKAIDSRLAKNKENPKENTISVEELLKNVSHKELVDFITRQAKYNPDYTNKLLLEFLHKATGTPENNYAKLLRKALKGVAFDYDDLYEYDDNAIEVDVLDEWFTKVRECISRKRFDEAIAICKACIEEYAEWMEEVEDEIIECIDPVYQEKPFEFLSEIASNPEVNSNELFQYCMAEMSKPKYSGPDMDDNFNDLLAELARTKNEFIEFITLQERLLHEVKDKSSGEAQKIIKRKIAFYQKNNQPETAWQLVSENLQIEQFRKQVVRQNIADGKFAEAKKLIADFLATSQNNNYYHSEWNMLALSIAQKEQDTPLIRKLAFAFIENHFEKEHYRIYKSAFNSGEWEKEVHNIIAHYEKKGKNFSNSVAEVLTEEHDASGLLRYIEKHLTIERVDVYHTHFAKEYPKETLDLFRKVVIHHAEKNIGRNHYEYLARLFKEIGNIEGGKEMATTLIAQFKVQYKNRRAMVGVFSNIKL